MAKYTIEVDGIYDLTILASINELLDSRGDDDVDHVSIYLEQSIGSLLGELKSHVSRSNTIAESPELWRKAAVLADAIAQEIRKKLDASGEA